MRQGMPVRVHGVFRGVGHASGSSDQNLYPVVKPVAGRGAPRSHPFVSILRGGRKGCGRRMDRRRRCHRFSYTFLPSHGVRLGTLNVQGLQWNLVLHEQKLQGLIQAARSHRFDLMLVSDMHYRDLDIHTVYLEEFCLVCRGAVGVLIRNNLAALWEAQGRKTFFNTHDRIFGLGFSLYNRDLAFISNYTPAGGDVTAKRTHYLEARSLYDKVDTAGFQQIWAEISMHILHKRILIYTWGSLDWSLLQLWVAAFCGNFWCVLI